MTTRVEIVEEAKSWIGVPYRHAGRDRFGVDCAGLIIKTAHNCGISDYDTTNYPKRPVPNDFLREMKSHLDRRPKKEAGHGSVLVFREPRHPCHSAILEIDERGERWIIHSYAPARKVIREHLSVERWSNCVMAFDYQGVED